MSCFVFNLREIDKTNRSIAGGKGASLGELIRIDGIRVPEGFCLSTDAFKRVIGETLAMNELLEQLSLLKVEDRDKISMLSSKIRNTIENAIIPEDIQKDIIVHLNSYGDNYAYAIRSSATAEDLPSFSFAGQQDTYLNITGKNAILKHISKCWASLFTDRAVIYRMKNGFDHNQAYIAVIVQRMILPQTSGVLFTADPVTSNRRLMSIDASFGLGEAVVSGLVNADNYKVRMGQVIDKKISTKKLAVIASKEGGTEHQEISFSQKNAPALTEKQILELERIGRKIEKHFGGPQDIEWCLADDTFYVLQSRSITTLFPIPTNQVGGPEAFDQENHVYVSVGHQQMMTDPIKPLGISFWMLTGNRAMFKTGGGRLFVDITKGLATPAGRQNLLNVLGHSDPLLKEVLLAIIERSDFIKPAPNDQSKPGPIKGHQGLSAADILAEAGNDPAIVADLIKSSEESVKALKHTIQMKSGLEVLDCILEDMQQRRQRSTDQKNLDVIMAAIHASAWLNEKMSDWLGEKNAADAISLSVPHNVTTEMGIELLDVSDVIRPYPEIIEYLQQVKDNDFVDELILFDGGQQVREAIVAFLDKYGMRCTGEIDITRTRWSENPLTIVPMILNNIKNLEPGASILKIKQGRQEALRKEQDLLSRLKLLPGGEKKAKETKQMVDLIRNFIGYREYPKYDIVCRYFLYKQALLKEAESLVQARIINEKEDIYYLTFEELQNVIHTRNLENHLIEKRKQEYRLYEKLIPPRVITSDGEIISGQYKRNGLPARAMVGLAVSSGVVEGKARVILKMEEADLEEGDILVTTFTDPGWTPLFLSIKGLITEVGGLMTHGAVISREYGLPGVVGVDNATKQIKDGQRIRVNGTEGYVEIL